MTQMGMERVSYVEKYKKIESLFWSKKELEQGKIIKIKTFRKNKR